MSVSQNEIVNIVRGFLLNAPPGEFMEVFADVRQVLGNDNLLNSVTADAFKQYNAEQMIIVDSPKGNKFLITQYGQLGNNEYIDPQGGLVVQYDHVKQSVSGSRAISGELDGTVEGFRKAFETAAIAYAADHYANGATTVYGAQENGQYVIRVCISSALFNAKNFWGGRWRSVWTATFNPGSGNCQINGNIKIQVHYFEDGNVQLNTDTNKSKSIPVADAAALASKFFNVIEGLETDFQNALQDNYAQMSGKTFKALRRQLPLNRQLIAWEKVLIGQYSIGSALGK